MKKIVIGFASAIGILLIIGIVAAAHQPTAAKSTAATSPASHAASPKPSPADTLLTAEKVVCKLRHAGATNSQIISATVSQGGDRSSAQMVVRNAEKSVCPAMKPASQTVEYVVTGSAADVTYGPSGSDLQGSVPMHVVKRLGDPQFYSISAQLNGSGTVRCAIKVNGKVISHATATGSYNIADCEVSKDPFSGKWQDTNSG